MPWAPATILSAEVPAGRAKDTACAPGPKMVFEVAVTLGRCRLKPIFEALKASGSGKTGCGAAPKTRPLNQRFVGGTRFLARRMGWAACREAVGRRGSAALRSDAARSG